MTHTENAELLRQLISGEKKELTLDTILPVGRALEAHIDDFESVVDIGEFKYCGDTYRSEDGFDVNSRLMGGLTLFAYARESLLAKQDKE